MDAGISRTEVAAIASSSAVSIVAVMPVFLTGALVIPMAADLAFGAAGLGIAAALFRGTQAVTSPFLGRFADRIGSTRALKLAALASAICSLGIASTANSLLVLCAWLCVGSTANALGQPAANRLLIHRVAERRRGKGFGLKQAAVPASSMLAGVSVPLIGLTIGWRWAFVIAGSIALSISLVLGSRSRGPRAAKPPRDDAPRTPLEGRSTLLMMSVAFGLGVSATAVVPTFFVDSAVTAGATQSLAGLVLAVGSISAILVRLVGGAIVDRFRIKPLRLCAMLLAVGTVGLVLLASGESQTMSLGVVLAMGGAWGFNGIFWYAMVSYYPATPGRVTGVLAPGGFIGATTGVAVFGFVAEGTGYRSAWSLAAGLAVLAAVGMLVGGARFSSTTKGISHA